MSDTVSNIPVPKTDLLSAIKIVRENIQAEIDEWTVKVKNDPVNAFEWADSAFEIGALASVARDFFYMINRSDKETWTCKELADWACDRLMDKSGHFASSTSIVSNAFDVKVVQAWNKIARAHGFSRYSVIAACYDLAYEIDEKNSVYVMYKNVDLKDGRKKVGTQKVYRTSSGTTNPNKAEAMCVPYESLESFRATADAGGFRFEKV